MTSILIYNPLPRTRDLKVTSSLIVPIAIENHTIIRRRITNVNSNIERLQKVSTRVAENLVHSRSNNNGSIVSCNGSRRHHVDGVVGAHFVARLLTREVDGLEVEAEGAGVGGWCAKAVGDGDVERVCRVEVGVEGEGESCVRGEDGGDGDGVDGC